MQNKTLLWITLIVLLVVSVFTDIASGSVSIPFKEIINFFSGLTIEERYYTILKEFRIPKTITAIITGASLSVAGLQMQTFFKNPLAGPYILGISSGASLGVALLLMSPLPVFLNQFLNISWLTSISAGIGSAIVLFIIFIISIRVKDVMTILIIGILIGSAVSALVTLLQYFGSQAELKTFIVWTMGSLSGVTSDQLKILLIFAGAGLLISFLSVRILNVLLLGENYAKTSGLNIRMSGIIIFTSTSILAGAVTAFCGPIGFVGIIVPHLARMIFKTANHKILIPASAGIGAILILISDIISQLPGYQGTIPINSVTAILGIPIVIRIILKNKI